MSLGCLKHQPSYSGPATMSAAAPALPHLPIPMPRLPSTSHRAGSTTGLWCCPPTPCVQAPVDPQLPALWGHIAILEGYEEGPTITTPQPLFCCEGSIRPCCGRVQVLLEQVRLWARSGLVKRVFRPHHHPATLQTQWPVPQGGTWEHHLSRHCHGNGLTPPLMQLVESVETGR